MPQATIVAFAYDADFRASIVFALEAEGLAVRGCTVADSAAIALARGAGCIIIDHRPAVFDGVAALETLRREGVAAPAIITVSSLPARLQRRIAAAGGEGMEKPLLGDMLLNMVRRVLNAAPD